MISIIAFASTMTTDAIATDSDGAGGDSGSSGLTAASSSSSSSNDVIDNNATMTIAMEKIGLCYAGGNVLWEGRGPIA